MLFLFFCHVRVAHFGTGPMRASSGGLLGRPKVKNIYYTVQN